MTEKEREKDIVTCSNPDTRTYTQTLGGRERQRQTDKDSDRETEKKRQKWQNQMQTVAERGADTEKTEAYRDRSK